MNLVYILKIVFPRVYDIFERHRLYRLGFLIKILGRSLSPSHKAFVPDLDREA